jgi:large subunit ribosomal protein L29
MRASEIRQMTDEDILDAIEDQKEALFNLRFQAAAGQLEDQRAIKRARHDIARLKTVLRERQLAAEHVKQGGTGNA